MKSSSVNSKSLIKINEIKGSFWGSNPIHSDFRGSFRRAFDFSEISAYLDSIGEPHFIAVNANIAFNSTKGTWRGLHMQMGDFAESKIVAAVEGSILDVFVDMRQESPTYLKTFQIELSANQGNFVFVPKGCAHGYLTLEPNTQVMYAVDAIHSPENEIGYCVHDPSLGISLNRDIEVISEKDKSWNHRDLI